MKGTKILQPAIIVHDFCRNLGDTNEPIITLIAKSPKNQIV